jgi:outer membrane receptor for ferrienterochelin and colicins
MRNRIPITLLASLLAVQAFAQAPITGTVLAKENNEKLATANVFWLGTTIGTTAGYEGEFSIDPPPAWPARLVASFVGYKPDTLLLKAPPTAPVVFTLRWAVDMGPVEIVERARTTQLDTRSQLATEIITAMELKRSACCDLSESFETNASVDVSYNDAISGTKTIRMLGLDGKYAQISIENIPFIRGLSTASGLTLIPGTWMSEINLSKGVGTAVNAPNAMTGQIDVCLLQPADEGPLYLNMYGNSQGRLEANIHTAQKTGKHSDNLLLVHGNWFNNEMDQNGDGFMDMPLTRRINLLDRWVYRNDRMTAQLAVRYVDDRRTGGQSAEHGAMPAPPEHVEHRPDELYTIDIRNEMVDVLGKLGFIMGGTGDKSIGLIVAGKKHDVRSLYGERLYTGLQESFYGNLVYQQQLGGCDDGIKAGLSFQYDDYREAFMDSSFARTELMPGIFAEYTRKRDRFTMVAGLRADANDIFGTAVSPRLHLKYDLAPMTVARISAGHGFRVANPLAESATVLASSRRVVVEGDLGMERAWNFGASMLHKFMLMDRKWELGVDVYHTRFTSQVVTDLDRDPQTIAFYMLDGLSYGTSLLADMQVQLSRPFTLRLNYRWYDARTTYDGRLLERPFTPMHRGMIDLAYADPKDRWRFDIGLNIFGESRIPDTSPNPEEYRFGERAPAFSTLHAQLTRVMGNWDIYLGAENITSTLQRRQIIAAEDPFGPFFDASLIWGPTNLAMVYGGIRFTLPHKTKTPPIDP